MNRPMRCLSGSLKGLPPAHGKCNTGSRDYRKVISHTFGRNKKSTTPDEQSFPGSPIAESIIGGQGERRGRRGTRKVISHPLVGTRNALRKFWELLDYLLPQALSVDKKDARDPKGHFASLGRNKKCTTQIPGAVRSLTAASIISEILTIARPSHRGFG